MRHCIKCKTSGWDVPSAEKCITSNISTATNNIGWTIEQYPEYYHIFKTLKNNETVCVSCLKSFNLGNPLSEKEYTKRIGGFHYDVVKYDTTIEDFYITVENAETLTMDDVWIDEVTLDEYGDFTYERDGVMYDAYESKDIPFDRYYCRAERKPFERKVVTQW